MKEYKSFLSKNINEFTSYKKARNELYEHYELILYSFDKYCYENYFNSNKLSQEILDNWCTKKTTEKNKSRNSRVSVIIKFVHFLCKTGDIDIVAPKLLKFEKRTHVPHAFTDQELKNFFYACDTIAPITNYRRQIIRRITVPVFFRLLYSTGMRPVEARLLKMEDIDFDQGIISIKMTKGYNQHFVALDNSMIKVLKKYNNEISIYRPNRDYLFTSSTSSYYGTKWVNTNFNQMWSKHNTEKNAIPYDFRHHYAITNINNWISEGVDFYDKLLYLSKSMGHSSLESTKYYYALVPAMSNIIDVVAKDSFDSIVPEVYDYED